MKFHSVYKIFVSLAIFSVPALVNFGRSDAGLIHEAAKSGNLEVVEQVLKETPFALDQKDESGQTPLHWAVQFGYREIVRSLLHFGANVDVPNSEGVTALDMAQKRFPEIADLLLMRPVPEGKQVILYIYLFDSKEENPGDPAVLFSDFKKQMESAFPARPVREVVATDSSALKKQLDDILGEGEVISHLVIRGHGGSYAPSYYRDKGEFISCGIRVGQSDIIEWAYPANQANEGLEKLLPEELDQILDEVNLNNIDLFSGIRGRFTDSTQVLITSCHLLEGTENEAKRRAQGIAHGLGLKNGHLYVNKSQGTTKLNFFLNPKVQLLSWGLTLGSWSLGCRLLTSAFIGSLPLVYLYGRSVYLDRTTNQGYHCLLSHGEMKIVPTTKSEYERRYFMIAPTAGENSERVDEQKVRRFCDL